MQTHLKNQTSYGAKLLKSRNSETYKLRRRVIEVIYKANATLVESGLDRLPRLEVRIVTEGDGSFAGYAYVGNKILHIAENTTKWKRSEADFEHVILHEIVHAIGYFHLEGCPLMHEDWLEIDQQEQWSIFRSYVEDFQSLPNQ